MHRKTYGNGDHEVEYNRQNEGQHKHERFIYGGFFAYGNEVSPFAHIVGHYEEHSRYDRHRYPGGVRHKHHQHKKKHNGVYHTRNRGSASVLYVCRSSCYRPRGGNSAKKRRAYVTRALCDKLGIRVVRVVDHLVRYYAGEQRLDCRENCDSENKSKYDRRPLYYKRLAAALLASRLRRR